jgi:hypothetical protein
MRQVLQGVTAPQWVDGAEERARAGLAGPPGWAARSGGLMLSEWELARPLPSCGGRRVQKKAPIASQMVMSDGPNGRAHGSDLVRGRNR